MKRKTQNKFSAEAQLEGLKKTLRQSQQQFQSLIKNIPGIVYLCYYDKHWTMQYMVKEIEKISGYPASDFINNNIRSYASIIHPDDIELVNQAIEKSISHDEPFEMEYRLIKKNNEIAWVYEKGQKVPGLDNKVWLSGIIFDITKQKQTAIALDIATKEWQVTFDAIPNAVFLLNRECQIIKCNLGAEILLERSRDKLIGKRYCKIIDGQDIPPGNSPYMRMLKSKQKETVIRSIAKKTVEFTISPILDPEEEIYGSVLIITDISKLEAAKNKF